ncbi:hypothetical protein CHY_0232 [Carboxydothermus hydrogenoformans Z-2901]|uniref:Uncharacterized protein n=1 Tax=Carboxydothermus hydrogenoformans (strain ATCC BAA-161 / DSM 6008 / Z-2901) TaxID=246194 RepID=Q3AFI0_CARHZ|nr:hypothetical protein CHY_0232 [Carboxydothermus hydrogenoformans Z-2901]
MIWAFFWNLTGVTVRFNYIEVANKFFLKIFLLKIA